MLLSVRLLSETLWERTDIYNYYMSCNTIWSDEVTARRVGVSIAENQCLVWVYVLYEVKRSRCFMHLHHLFWHHQVLFIKPCTMPCAWGKKPIMLPPNCLKCSSEEFHELRFISHITAVKTDGYIIISMLFLHLKKPQGRNGVHKHEVIRLTINLNHNLTPCAYAL